ncbi:MAG: sodium ion-translocating decarboxylase subunit beta, partial [Oscillospiraceae bacterium]|nr:sodium ion-translocating decarboxylase subunit beta [Oscillospiraceae bacterium]
MNFLQIFQGVGTLFELEPAIAIGRLVFVFLGVLLVWLGNKRILEPLIMVPMGFGLVAINAGMLFSLSINIDGDPGSTIDLTNIIINPMESTTAGLMNLMQVDFLQPIYTLMFSNGLIACLVFMGIGVITDI